MPFDQPVEIAEMNYTHLTREKRYQIYALKKAGHTQIEIAQLLKRSPATISRELIHNQGGRDYPPAQEQSFAEQRCAINARQIDDEDWQFAKTRLKEQWSPEQISDHVAISTGTIYQRVYTDKQNSG